MNLTSLLYYGFLHFVFNLMILFIWCFTFPYGINLNEVF